MSHEVGDDDADLFLSAMADGESEELTAEARQTVLRHLAARPEAAARLATEVRMRQAVSRSMAAMVPAPSGALRHRIEVLARESGRTKSNPSRGVVRVPRGWTRMIFPAAAAAVMFLAVGLWVGRAMNGDVRGPVGPLPASLVADVTHVHVDCSRAPDHHTAAFPRELGTLEGSLEKYLGRSDPYPDLSSIGYQYIGAGPCAKPLENMVHLLYRAKGSQITDTVSLFVRGDGPNESNGKLQGGRVYWAAGRDAAHPMIVWRRDNMTFFLVGDSDKPVLEAAEVMGIGAPL